VDIAVANITLMRDSIRQLYASWRSKLDAGLPEEADEVRGQLLATIAQYGQSTDQAIQGILDQANLLATQLRAQGKNQQASEVMSDAQIRVRDLMKQQTDEQIAMLDEAQRTDNAILAFASQLDAILPGNPFSAKILPALAGLAEGAGAAADDLKKKFGEAEPGSPAGLLNRFGGYVSGLGEQRPSPATVLDQPQTNLGAPLSADKAQKYTDAQNNQLIIANIQGATQAYIQNQTRDLRVEAAQTKDPKTKARIERMIARLTLGILQRVNDGIAIPGVSEDDAAALGDASVDQEQITQAQVDFYNQSVGLQTSQHDYAMQAAQQAADIRQAQLGVSAALAQARGDAVQAARVQVQVARAQLALARQQAALAITPAEVAAAKVATLNAQAALITANAAVDQAQQDLVQSRFQVAIALAESAGHTVEAARRTLAAARQALQAALRKSGGKITAEVNAARVQAIQAEAALRDAKLQDSLDTINFNLEMGKITQASAIAALQEILRTQDLTKQQRRQLLLQIKGMKDELAGSQWNFGDIKLPTPYQMRRYIAERRDQFRNELDAAAGLGGRPNNYTSGPNGPRREGDTTYQENKFYIDGADIAKVRKIIEDVVGKGGGSTRTTGARRGR
jgi:hypothetical protein